MLFFVGRRNFKFAYTSPAAPKIKSQHRTFMVAQTAHKTRLCHLWFKFQYDRASLTIYLWAINFNSFPPLNSPQPAIKCFNEKLSPITKYDPTIIQYQLVAQLLSSTTIRPSTRLLRFLLEHLFHETQYLSVGRSDRTVTPKMSLFHCIA